jgi:hypothetical protein
VNAPVFCLTSDIDWASDACLLDLYEFARELGVPVTFFITHATPVLDVWRADPRVELGVHPNFLPGSSHGTDVGAVVSHVMELVPEARSWRSHSFVDGSPFATALRDRGIRWRSNVCYFLEPELRPLRHWTGIVEAPVFWEDDVHWHRHESWDFPDHAPLFSTPGLKVLNTHPIHFALNTPDAAEYARHKHLTGTLNTAALAERRFPGPGTRTFVRDLVTWALKQGYHFATLSELCQLPNHPSRSTP